MKIVLHALERKLDPAIHGLVEEYLQRAKRTFDIELRVVTVKHQTQDTKRIKKEEAKKLLNTIPPTDHMVLLDEKGRLMNSVDFAGFIEKKGMDRHKSIHFVIGGAYGFDDAVYQRANEQLALSKMTFPHQLARLVFVEQLYRAATIKNGMPYHH